MWVTALDNCFNCKCKRDDLICKGRCDILRDDEDEEEFDAVGLEVVDFDKRWVWKLRLIPLILDSYVEYSDAFGSFATIASDDSSDSEANGNNEPGFSEDMYDGVDEGDIKPIPKQPKRHVKDESDSDDSILGDEYASDGGDSILGEEYADVYGSSDGDYDSGPLFIKKHQNLICVTSFCQS